MFFHKSLNLHISHSFFISHICTTHSYSSFFFFFNDTATTEIYTLSLHDALPISDGTKGTDVTSGTSAQFPAQPLCNSQLDRKSTRLNSSHANISYAVFCLKKKKKIHKTLMFTIINEEYNRKTVIDAKNLQTQSLG